MEQKNALFSKSERLCGVKVIDDLFDSGKMFHAPLFRAVCSITAEDETLSTVRILISVPKKHFRKAVIRNLLRRRIREAYRKNKMPFITTLKNKRMRVDMAIIWRGPVRANYRDIELSMIDLFSKIGRQA